MWVNQCHVYHPFFWEWFIHVYTTYGEIGGWFISLLLFYPHEL